MIKDAKKEYRAEQYFVAIRARVHINEVPKTLPPLVPKVIAWLKENKTPTDGTVFFHYRSINEQNELDVAVGSLVRNKVTGDGHVEGGLFPAGHYAVITFMGDYRYMKEGHMALEKWINENGFKEHKQKTEHGIIWGGRTEFYITDPDTEPDVDKWRTDIAFLLED